MEITCLFLGLILGVGLMALMINFISPKDNEED
jgi:hypothetical protein